MELEHEKERENYCWTGGVAYRQFVAAGHLRKDTVGAYQLPPIKTVSEETVSRRSPTQ